MQLLSRTGIRIVVSAALLATLVSTPAAQRKAGAVPADPDEKTIVHVLNRLGFGPVPGQVDRVRELGLKTYIDQQLAPERIADSAMAERLAEFTTLRMSPRELAEKYYLPAMADRRAQQQSADAAMAKPTGTDMMAGEKPAPERPGQGPQGPRLVMAELTQLKLLRAAYSERQLEEVMVDFWFNHFNVFAGKGPTRMYVAEYEQNAIRPHALGKFRDILGEVAQSPAMLFYLDNWQSAAPESAQNMAPPRRRPGQFARPGQPARPMPPNRPKGINENYARELMELHTLGVEGGYTQKDVQEIARAFTGWTITQPRQGGEFRFDPRMHDDGEKQVLGVKIPSGGGRKDGERVLDILAKHPSTAKFVATKLARRFVADEPPKALVDRAAARFRDTDGDIREVVRTIVTSPEFFAPSSYRAKVKTPLEFVASAVRASGVDVRNSQPLIQAMAEMGMPPYMCQPPTGYADKADAWVNTGALLSRMNFAVMLSSGDRLRRGGPGRGRGFESPDRSANRVTVTQAQIAEQVLAGDLSENTRLTVAKATTEPQKIALLLGSPDFQKR
ncbi:MAG TPA: DUF1800 domain-containing protein [Vicinamibacterales bacterium]|nr:DUF1800 domain-containing protein [Vicinamibacterales bacterium]